MAGPRDDLKEELKNPEFVKEYGSEVAKNEIGKTLFKIRKRMPLTQKQLSDKLGISQPYIAKLESGEANPTIGSVGEILAVLGFILVTDTVPMKSEVNPTQSTVFVNWEYLFPPKESLPPQAGTSMEITIPAKQKSKDEVIICNAATACPIKGGSVQ